MLSQLFSVTKFSGTILKFSYQSLIHVKSSSHVLKTLTFHTYFKSNYCSEPQYKGMDRQAVVKIIESLFSKELAESWDNTGLIIDSCDRKVSKILLTNDLTLTVLEEAVSRDAHFILSYHPPIFKAMKQISTEHWKGEVVVKCISAGISVYSHHTSCDVVRGGVNDWLIKCFDFEKVKPIQERGTNCRFECTVPRGINLNLSFENLKDNIMFLETETTGKHNHVTIIGKNTFSSHIHQILANQDGVEILNVSSGLKKYSNDDESIGVGRIGRLMRSLTLRKCIQNLKEHLKLPHIRFAMGRNASLDKEIWTIGSCAGSGGSVLQGVDADLLITGEMSHHEILDAQQRGVSVLLCEHSNSERGYLLELASILSDKMDGVEVMVSVVDKDPVTIV